ncbi:MAG: glycosyltransferase, partial [Desulfuromonadales bacterium]|nr:glycosyltransferase [Desulfuromonadales bacterium]
VVKHMRAADCFVFPSLFEGSAITLYEAVGAGLGIIQSAASGIGAEDGRNGLCLDTVSVDALTEAIMAVVSDR